MRKLCLVDNTSANLGKRNPVKTRVLEKNQEWYFLDCPCDIIHNAAHKGSPAFTKVTSFDVEGFCIGLYYRNASIKRPGRLLNFLNF